MTYTPAIDLAASTPSPTPYRDFFRTKYLGSRLGLVTGGGGRAGFG